MTTQVMTLEDLKRTLKAAAGESEGVDLAGDIGDARFEDLGYDSLALLETSSRIEHEYGIRIPEDDLTEAETPNELLKLVNFRQA